MSDHLSLLDGTSGVFITLEGTEGVGKSTHLQFIQDYFQKNNLEYIVSREPGGTPLAEEIRNILLSPREESFSELTELLLIFAARAQHIETKIKPALASGKSVISDRFTDATFAYQGGGRGLSVEVIGSLEKMVQGALQPDLTILLDLPVSVGLSRASNRGELDRFEQEQISFFESVRESYLTRAKKYSERFEIVDASGSIEEIQSRITTVLTNFIHGEL